MKPQGYIPSTIQADHYVLGGVGSLPKVVIKPDGQWLDLMPPYEAQNKGFETYDCTGFATLNCVEALIKHIGFDVNYSDRFMGIVAGTARLKGNDPHTVAEALRHYGAVAEGVLPFNENIKNIDEFYSFKGNRDERSLRDAGIDWTWAWTFGHEWVFNGAIGNKQEIMKEALQYSPLGVSVNAWIKGNDGKFIKPPRSFDNHWTMIVGYEDGEYWIVNDSYLNDGLQTKYLDWNYDFGCAKRYHIEKNNVWHKPTFLQSVLSAIMRFFGI